MKNYRRGKTTQLDWSYLSELSTERDTWICVSERDKALLSAGLVPLRWSTRYFNQDALLQLPDMIDELDAYMTMNETCCSSIVDCILNDAETQNALRKVIGGGVGGGDNLGSDAPLLENCPNDVVFGAVTELVKYTNQAIIDAFEKIELATNVFELAGEWLEGFPVVGGALSVIPDMINWIQEGFQESYEAGYTVGVENDIRCDYFCLYTDSCVLTVDMLLDYHFSELTSNPLPDNAWDLIESIIAGGYIAEQAVHAMFSIVYGLLALGDEVNERLPFITLPAPRELATTLKLGANNPDPDWSIICDPCPQTWCTEYAFETSAYSAIWTPVPFVSGFPALLYDSGLGYRTQTATDGSGYGAMETVTLTSPTYVDTITLFGEIISGGDSNVTLLDESGGVIGTATDIFNGSGEVTITVESSVTKILLRLNNTGGNTRMTSLRINGEGEIPTAWEGDVCSS